MEAHQKHGPNVLIFQLETGPRCWFIVGCYLDPTGASKIECIIEAMGQNPQGANMMVVGDLNEDILEPEGN